MAALCNRAGHYIFALWFLSSSIFFFFSSRNLSGRRLDLCHTSTHGVAQCKFRMHVWNVLHAARWKYRTQKKSPFWRHRKTLSGYIFALYLRNWGMYRQSEKNLLSSNISSTSLHNMVNFGPLAAEILSFVWGTPGNFNGFRVLAALLHGTLVVGVSQTLRR